jgi:hypothetical protein
LFSEREGTAVMNESTRSEADLEMKCYATFMLAIKAVGVGINHEFSPAEYMKIWSVVNEVAEGKQTLNISPSELTVNSPEMLPAMRVYIQQSQQGTMRKEQELAKMLVAASVGFVVRDNNGK